MPSVFTFDELGGQFRVMRHYIKGLVTSWVNSSTSTLTDNVWRIEGTFLGTDTYEEYVLRDTFLPPSSNRYTPDHIVQDHYYVNLPSTAHLNPLPIDVKVHIRPSTKDVYLSLDSLNFPALYYLDLAPYALKWPER